MPRKTLKEKKAEHATMLDATWKQKYPNGRFVYMTMDGPQSQYTAVIWEPRRATSHVRAIGFGFTGYGAPINHVPGGPFCKTRGFGSLEALVWHADQRGFDSSVLESFVKMALAAGVDKLVRRG